MDTRRIMNTGLAGIKTYEGGKHKEEAKEKYAVREPVKMSSNENAIGVSPKALDLAKRVLPESNIYPDGSNRNVREILAARLNVDPGQVIVGNGGDEIIYYIAMSILNDDDEVVIPEITFPIYEIACRLMRARIVYSPMNGLFIDTDAILEKITERTKLVTLCNPNNPTGHALGSKEVFKLIDSIPENILLLIDEAYMDFADPETFPDSLSRFRDGKRTLFIVRTLSKAYGLAGFRVGYGIGDEAIVELMNRIKLPFNISVVSQHAAVAALGDTEFLRETIRSANKGKNDICRFLKANGLDYIESSTNFILIDTGRESDLVTEELMKRGVIVRSAKAYGLPTSIRVTVGSENDNRRFIAAMKEVLR